MRDAPLRSNIMKQYTYGFSLVELLAVIAATAIMAGLLIPIIGCGGSGKVNMDAALVQTVANGANLYKAIFASEMDNIVLGKESASWPQSGQYSSSTEYFVNLVKTGVINVTYDFFAAPGIPPAKSSNASDFTSNNNAWRLVLGLDKAEEGTPFLFTRNYDPGAIQGGDDDIVLSGQPFGDYAMVVVLKGGSAFSLRGNNQLKNSYFNPAGSPPTDANISIVGP